MYVYSSWLISNVPYYFQTHILLVTVKIMSSIMFISKIVQNCKTEKVTEGWILLFYAEQWLQSQRHAIVLKKLSKNALFVSCLT